MEFIFHALPPHHAAELKSPEIARLLLVVGRMNVQLPEMWTDNTPLHFAAYFGRLETVRLLLAMPTVQVNAKNIANKTALDLARARNKWDVVHLLGEHGAK